MNNTILFRNRFWGSETSSTAVMFMPLEDPKVWLHTNIGWVPIGNTPENAAEAEQMAIDLAKNYFLEEKEIQND
jgi:hypothetical protein